MSIRMEITLPASESPQKTVHFKNSLGVFQGGGCKAIAFIGAFEEARSRGVYFSELAGTSAGSIFAALIAAGATPEYLNDLVITTDFTQFNAPVDKTYKKYGTSIGHAGKILTKGKYKNLFNFILNLGLYSSSQLESWINERLGELLNKRGMEIKFCDLKLPLYVIATDVENQNQITWSTANTPDEKVAYAVRCSCTIPFYFQPVDMKYVDGGLVSNLPTFSLNNEEGHYEKILCFTLSDKYNKVKCIESYLTNMASAVIDGAVHIQNLFQSNTYHIEIKDLPITTTAFNELTDRKIEETIQFGRKAAANFFDYETVNITNKYKSTKKTSRDQILNTVVMVDPQYHDKILVSLPNTRLVYSLFPTILDWIYNKVSVIFITNKINKDDPDEIEHEKYRRVLLKKLGVAFFEVESIPFSCFLFKSKDHESDTSIAYYDNNEQSKVAGYGKVYRSIHDKFVHDSFWNAFKEIVDINATNSCSFYVETVPTGELTRMLKDVRQYRSNSVHIQLKNIEICKVKFLTQFVKSYKYNQISKFIRILDKFKIEHFEACAIITADGTKYLVTPPVVEKYHNEYRLIEGNSRLIFSYRELQVPFIKAIVVEHVSVELPSSGAYSIDSMIITTKDKIGSMRYEKFKYEFFRKIEENVRPPKMYL